MVLTFHDEDVAYDLADDAGGVQHCQGGDQDESDMGVQQCGEALTKPAAKSA